MLCSSNLLFLFFLLSNVLFKKHLSISWKRIVLIICLLLALVPVALLKWAVLYALSHFTDICPESLFTVSGYEQAIIFTAGKLRMTNPLEWKTLLTVIWFVGGVIVLIYRFSQYLNRRRRIERLVPKANDPALLSVVEQYKKELGIKCPVTVYVNDQQCSSFTTGARNPIIVLPENLEPCQQNMILRHELCHIKNGDHIYGLLRMLVLSLYWFDPLFYLMARYMEKVSELASDTKATALYSSDQNTAYSNLIVSMVAAKSSAYHYAFSSSAKNIEERIINVMLRKPTTKKGKVITAILSCFMVLVSSMPVLAYQQPKVLRVDTYDQQAINISTNLAISYDKAGSYGSTYPNKILYHVQFTDSNGIIYEANDDAEARWGCDEHAYDDGVFEMHESHSDGSCTLSVYDAERCTKCGHILVGVLTQEMTFKFCPH